MEIWYDLAGGWDGLLSMWIVYKVCIGKREREEKGWLEGHYPYMQIEELPKVPPGRFKG